MFRKNFLDRQENRRAARAIVTVYQILPLARIFDAFFCTLTNLLFDATAAQKGNKVKMDP